MLSHVRANFCSSSSEGLWLRRLILGGLTAVVVLDPEQMTVTLSLTLSHFRPDSRTETGHLLTRSAKVGPMRPVPRIQHDIRVIIVRKGVSSDSSKPG